MDSQPKASDRSTRPAKTTIRASRPCRPFRPPVHLVPLDVLQERVDIGGDRRAEVEVVRVLVQLIIKGRLMRSAAYAHLEEER